MREIVRLDETRRLEPAKHSVASNQAIPPRILRALQRDGLDRFPVSVSVSQPEPSVPRLEDSYAYEIKVEDAVHIEAESVFGAMSACNVLNALRWEHDSLPSCHIRDAPVYPWRGLMIDTSRHFMPFKRLLETVDLMACYRLNVLHLNLSNDQACRFPSDRFERLAASEHYSKPQLVELVDYAADRGIRVVPELDVPGHTTSWVWAYPSWGAGALSGPSTGFGVHVACLDPTRDDVLEAVKHLFSELAEVFPDEYVHVGGDEVNPTWWRANPTIQVWMAEHGMDSTHALQTWFIRQLGDHLATLGRRLIGWDEVLDAQLPQDYVIQAWRGMVARDHAVAAGHKTLVSSPYYLDLMLPADGHFRYEPQMSPEAFDEASRLLAEDPRVEHVRDGIGWQTDFGEFPSLTAREGGSVLGGEACMWSEIVDGDSLHTRVWSRMPAIAERFWSGSEALDVETVYDRTERGLAHWRRVQSVDSLMSIPAALQPPELQSLIEQLEPIKWYARLIGMDLVHRRTSGQASDAQERPYDVDTKLNRLVDYLPPESFAARRVKAALNNDEPVDEFLTAWRQQARELKRCAEEEPRLAELQPVSERLATLADVYAGRQSIDMALTEPVGEYLLPIAKPILYAAVRKLAQRFGASGEVREITKGHINDTFAIDESLLLQRINGDIFDAMAVIENRAQFDDWIHDLIPRQAEVEAGVHHWIGVDGEVWRAAEFAQGRNFDVLPTELCEAAGEAFGDFLSRLQPCQEHPRTVIQGFHDIGEYLLGFDDARPTAESQPWVDFVNARRATLTEFDAEDFQVIHGDCKVNNLIFHQERPEVAKIVDLDTLMWGHPAWDFGDLVRSVVTGAAGNTIDRERLQLVVDGFTETYSVEPRLVETFARAPAHMSFMLGVRFLTDHLNGDAYFKVARPGMNLERAIEQFRITEALEAIAEDLERYFRETIQNSS